MEEEGIENILRNKAFRLKCALLIDVSDDDPYADIQLVGGMGFIIG